MRSPSFPIALIAAYNAAQVWCGDQCFDINQVQQDNLPCAPSASVSSCCGPGWTCLSNGLCTTNNKTLNTGLTELYAGLCTDPLWENEKTCPKICYNNVTSGIKGNGVTACGDGNFCCWDGTDTTCCSTSSSVFFLGAATIVTTLTGSSSTPTSTQSRTSVTSSAVSTTAVTDPGSSPSLPKAAATSSTRTATSTIAPTPTPSGGSDSHVSVGVGVGVGVPVGLAVLAGLFYLMRRQSKIRPEGSRKIGVLADKNEHTIQHELPARNGPVELFAGSNGPVELFDPHGPRVEIG
ncbi:hypothetical protein BDR22DRAFT_886324 [Usnea florida]